MRNYFSFILRVFFAALIIEMINESNGQASKRPDTLECGDLNTRLQDCWGEEFMSELPSCEDKNILLTCAEAVQEQFSKCPNYLSFRQILDSTLTNYQRIIDNICSQPELLTDFRHYNNCWSLAALCVKQLSVAVKGLIGPLSCRYAQECVDMCLRANRVSFQGNPIDPKQCVETQLPDKFARLVYESVDCGTTKELCECSELFVSEAPITTSLPFSIITIFIVTKTYEIYICL